MLAALQLGSAIVLHAVCKDQIMGASRRALRVSLHKAQPRKGPREAGELE